MTLSGSPCRSGSLQKTKRHHCFSVLWGSCFIEVVISLHRWTILMWMFIVQKKSDASTCRHLCAGVHRSTWEGVCEWFMCRGGQECGDCHNYVPLFWLPWLSRFWCQTCYSAISRESLFHGECCWHGSFYSISALSVYVHVLGVRVDRICVWERKEWRICVWFQKDQSLSTGCSLCFKLLSAVYTCLMLNQICTRTFGGF